MRIAVVGAHLDGQPLNGELLSRGATLVSRTTTAPEYRLFALATEPRKPGLVRVATGTPGAAAIEVEVWELEPLGFASFVDAIPSPLAIGRLRLADGSDVAGFLCEPIAVEGAPDITEHGGWRKYLSAAPPD